MSLAKVKSAIDKLSDEEQFHLRNYLQEKMLDNEEWRDEMSRRVDAMDEGKILFGAIRGITPRLESKGR